VPWAKLTQSTAAGRVQNIAGLADDDGSKPGWQITRRDVAYTVTLSVCTVDDAADGFAATHDSSFCATSGSSSQPADTNPTDYRRATFNLSWNDQNGPRTLRQTTLVTNVDSGPAVASVSSSTMSGQSPYVYAGSASVLSFDVTTDQPAAKVDWYLSGTKMGAATGSSTSWSFAWSIGAATGGQANGTPSCSPTGGGKLDGTYFTGAQAFDASDLSAGLQAATVSLNRCSPKAPSSLTAGKSTALGTLEVSWDENAEDDIAGYRTYRSASSSGPFTQVAAGSCSGLLNTTDCLDTDPSLGSLTVPKYYRVYAVDRDAAGALREGDLTSIATVPTNGPPTTPVISSGGSSHTLTWPSSSDPNPGDSVALYWIYRDGQAFAKRWDAADHVSGGISWDDPDPSGGPHDYWVTSADNRGNESAYSNKVTQ
jgi:hypothetical protein